MNITGSSGALKIPLKEFDLGMLMSMNPRYEFYINTSIDGRDALVKYQHVPEKSAFEKCYEGTFPCFIDMDSGTIMQEYFYNEQEKIADAFDATHPAIAKEWRAMWPQIQEFLKLWEKMTEAAEL